MMMTMDYTKNLRNWNNQMPDSDIDWSVFENAGKKIIIRFEFTKHISLFFNRSIFIT